MNRPVKKGQVQASAPARKASTDVPNVTTTKAKMITPKVNLNAAQNARFSPGIPGQSPFGGGPYQSQIPERFTAKPEKQILRMDDQYNPYKEFYLDKMVGILELPTRNKMLYLIPEQVNQNRFLASPLNFRGVMQTVLLIDTNLLRTGQMF